MNLLRLLILAGLPLIASALIAAGVYLIYPPAALIVAGVLILLDLHRKDTKS